MRVCRTCSVFFSFREKTAGENSMRIARTCSLFFFLGEKFLCVIVQKLAGATLYLLYKVGERKKGFQNRVFEKRGGGKSRAAVLLLLLYIYIYIYSIIVIVVDRNTRFFFNFFYFEPKKLY
jgi:hypothetical protein